MADDRSSFTIERSFWMALSAIFLVTILFLTLRLIDSNPSGVATLKPQGGQLAPRDKINFVYNTIVTHYIDEVDGDDLAQKAIIAMLDSLEDPYSSYLNRELARNLSDTVKGNFGGLGIIIGKKKASEPTLAVANNEFYIEVFSTVAASPAALAGIMNGDYISAIEGQSVASLTIEEAVDKLRGPIGSNVTITVVRGDHSFDATLKRAKIEIETVKWALLPTGQGYIKINQFTPATRWQLRKAIDELTAQGMSAMIIDLRNNGGGSYDAAVAIANDFLNEGVIVSTKGRMKQQTSVEKATKGLYVDKQLKIVVLINQYSASASEIFAGALSDHQRATLVGSTSYGKGRVQQLFSLNAQSTEGFKLTVSSYFTPNGTDINEHGIKPDIEVPDLVTDNEENIANLQKLLNSNSIDEFLKIYPSPSIVQLNQFAATQQKGGIALPAAYIMQIVNNIAHSRMTNPPLFDLTFDETLIKAIESLD